MAAEPSQNGFLDIEFQGNVVRTQALNFDVLRIGRSPDNDLPLQHPGISREHLELRLTPGGLLATDLNSSNGTFVDGVRILPYQPTGVELGQVLQIGPYVLVMRRTPLDRPGGMDPVGNGRARSALNGAAEGNLMTLVPTFPRRPTLAVPDPKGPSSKYLNYLPAIFSENDFLGRFLLIFEAIWEPFEQRQDHIAMYFDPATCPESVLAWLADWYQMPIDKHWPEARIRGLVAEMTELYRFRGTTYGLAKMIEIWTGIAPEILEDPKQPFVFTVRLRVPSGASIDREVIEDLLKAHKPAASGYVLDIVA